MVKVCLKNVVLVVMYCGNPGIHLPRLAWDNAVSQGKLQQYTHIKKHKCCYKMKQLRT